MIKNSNLVCIIIPVILPWLFRWLGTRFFKLPLCCLHKYSLCFSIRHQRPSLNFIYTQGIIWELGTSAREKGRTTVLKVHCSIFGYQFSNLNQSNHNFFKIHLTCLRRSHLWLSSPFVRQQIGAFAGLWWPPSFVPQTKLPLLRIVERTTLFLPLWEAANTLHLYNIFSQWAPVRLRTHDPNARRICNQF